MSAASEAHGLVVDKLIGDHDAEKAKLVEAHLAEIAAKDAAAEALVSGSLAASRDHAAEIAALRGEMLQHAPDHQVDMDERAQKASRRLVQQSIVPHNGKQTTLLDAPVSERSSDTVAAIVVPDIHEDLQHSGGDRPLVSAAGDFADLLLEEEEALLDVYNRVSAKRGGGIMDSNGEVQAAASWIAEKLVIMSATSRQQKR
jgi:hypothetical protein